jgi:hypothetical protein
MALLEAALLSYTLLSFGVVLKLRLPISCAFVPQEHYPLMPEQFLSRVTYGGGFVVSGHCSDYNIL